MRRVDGRLVLISFVALACVAGCGNKVSTVQENTANQSAAPKTTYLPPPEFLPPPASKQDLSKETAGDSAPPEVRTEAEAGAIEKLFYTPPPLPAVKKVKKIHNQPVQFSKRKINGVPFYQAMIDLSDPQNFIVIRLPDGATQANCPTYTKGHQNFDSFVKHYPASVVVNGTFFSKDDQERVMGNMISEGKFLKYSPWENYGTTLSLSKDNEPEMVTARADGKPVLTEKWFSLTCGPRLLKDGEVWLNPALEGFMDPHVLGAGPRSAIGYDKSRTKLYLISFLRGLTLPEEAKMMKAIGCYDAMNLDGGASKGLASNHSVILKPGRGLTNVLVVYDGKNKAPAGVAESWRRFQSADAKVAPLAVN